LKPGCIFQVGQQAYRSGRQQRFRRAHPGPVQAVSISTVSVIMSSDLADIHRQLRIIGAALLRVNFNNTHSGNMSCRDAGDPDRFWVTASGSQCGNLLLHDVVPVRFDDMSWVGAARPSLEANTHRRVLSLPGVTACIHCHSIASTLLGFETPQNPIFLLGPDTPEPDPREYLFQPLDDWGAGLIGAVWVGRYSETVGSAEMEERIPGYLRQDPTTIVMGHGPFARGASLEECLHYLSVLENSAAVVIGLRRRGVDTLSIQRAIRSRGAHAVSPGPLRRLRSPVAPAGLRITDPEISADFGYWLSYNYGSGLGAFGTGSMSRRVSADEMIFCPMSAAPEGVEVPLHRLPLRAAEPEAADVDLHRRIYAHTPFSACMAAAAPLAVAEGLAALVEAQGLDALAAVTDRIGSDARPAAVVAPIDAEALHYKVRLPVVGAAAVGEAEHPIPRLLRRADGCCLLAGYGVIAVGEKNLGQAAYRVSLVERSARFRQEVDLTHRLLGGPPVEAFEKKAPSDAPAVTPSVRSR
jgi:L-fuculose-phosphate aldolase